MKTGKEILEVLNILIVDDHKMIRDGISVMLTSLKKDYQFNVTEAESGEEAIKIISRKDFDVVIIDYRLPGINGAQTVEYIMRYKPETKFLALSNYDELPYIESMISAGASGYILKNIEPYQLLNAIKTVMNNKSYYSNEVAIKLIEGSKKTVLKSAVNNNKLTKREIEVLKLIAMEYTNEEIAKQLSVGKRTIDTHRQNLLLKLQAKNTVGLTKAAYALNLVE
jgi:DNA-binding NarL/FixJ family response regulator